MTCVSRESSPLKCWVISSDRHELSIIPVNPLAVIYGDLLVQYPRDTAAQLAALVASLDDTQPLAVQHTAARVLSALVIHRLIKHELVLPSLARQLLHSDAALAALALSFFAQLAARGT